MHEISFLVVSLPSRTIDSLAIKQLTPALSSVHSAKPPRQEDVKARRLFLAEARLTSRIHHPNVVQTQDLFEHEAVPYIAMSRAGL